MSNTIPQAKRKYRSDIDGLRAFAVIAVIINHFNKDLLPSGYLGVDIFFVISGYVITASLSGRESKNFGSFLSDFYKRRFRRLVPALVAFILLTSLLVCLFNAEPQVALKTGITSLFGLSNLYLLKQSTDYFAQSSELNPFTHTWSLGVEAQFYILFPFLIWFSGFSRQTKHGARNIFLWIGILTVASLSGFIYLYSTNQPAAYFLMPTRFWEMAAGCLILIGFEKRKKIEQLLERVPPFLVLVTMVGVMFLPLNAAVPATILIVTLSAVLLACLKSGTAAFTVFTNKRLVYIGLISYSLYLWHWGILSISRWTIGIHWWSIPFQIVLMLVASALSYKWIEEPLRKRQLFLHGKYIKLSGSLLLALSTILVLTLTINGWNKYLYLGSYSYEELMTRSRNYTDNQIVGEPQYAGHHCHLNQIANKLPTDCKISRDSSVIFYFVGNSHADHFRETQYLLSSDYGLTIEGITVSTCVFPADPTQKKCGSAQKRLENQIVSQVNKGDVVVISNRFVVSDEPSVWLKTSYSIDLLNNFSEKIFSKGGRIILFSASPEFTVESRSCVRHWFRVLPSSCSIKVAEMRSARKKEYSLMQTLLDKRILIFDPIPALCMTGKCEMTDASNKPLFIDMHHLTDYANRTYVYPAFNAFLKHYKLI
jgi:peptidoglycan/LPS O-acetylase OafA/YrhL